MAYELHIIRAAEAGKSAARPISLDEWRAFVERTPELRLEEVARATNPATGEVIEIACRGRAVWLAHPRGVPASFEHRDGKITVASPDEATRSKMKELAGRLGARVVGDEGEEYR